MPEKPFPPLTIGLRLRVIMRLLWSLRRHDFRAARTFMAMSFPDDRPVMRLVKFVGWALYQMTSAIPDAMRHTRFAGEVSKVPVWLKDGNPLENHPWSSQPEAELPDAKVVDARLNGQALHDLSLDPVQVAGHQHHLSEPHRHHPTVVVPDGRWPWSSPVTLAVLPP